MRNIRIYQEGVFKPGDLVSLSENASHHIWHVLRQAVGNKIIIFSNNVEYEAVIENYQKKYISVKVLSQKIISRETANPINLVFGMPKHEIMDNIVQKATELGIASLSPLVTEYSNISLNKLNIEKKMSQWKNIAISACEQCERNKIPSINSPILFSDFVEHNSVDNYIVMHPNANETLLTHLNHKNNSNPVISGCFIGPEGGFSKSEIATLTKLGLPIISLGPRILRVETAVITSLALIQAFQE